MVFAYGHPNFLSMGYKLSNTLLLILLSLTIFSQTKKIAYKSHSGSSENYYASFNSIFETESSNFGLGPVRLSFLDSVVFLTDTSSIFSVRYQYIYANDTTPDEVSIDTFLNESIFGGYQDKDSLKSDIINRYGYFNDVDSVKFIDRNIKNTDTVYINQEIESKEKNELILPLTSNDNQDSNNTKGPSLQLLIGVLVFLSVLLGILVNRIVKKEIKATHNLS